MARLIDLVRHCHLVSVNIQGARLQHDGRILLDPPIRNIREGLQRSHVELDLRKRTALVSATARLGLAEACESSSGTS